MRWGCGVSAVGDVRGGDYLESPVRVGVVRLTAESLLERWLIVLFIVGSGRVCRERPSNGFRYGGRRGDVGALRVESVLVGRVLDGDGGAVGRGIRVSALNDLRCDRSGSEGGLYNMSDVF